MTKIPLFFFIVIGGILLLLSESVFSYVENPFDEAKISVSLSNLSMPKIYTSEKDIIDYEVRSSWGASFVLDLPVWRYLHSGFVVRYLVSPKVGDIGGIVDLGGVLKPMIGFGGSLGYLSFYLFSTCGLSVTFMPIINKNFTMTEEEMKAKEPIKKHVNVFGGLFNASAKLGVEYFPFSQFGLFAEGGFSYWYFLHQIDEKLFQPTFKMFSYHLTGVIADAGIKFVF